jgi:hypothetical protein
MKKVCQYCPKIGKPWKLKRKTVKLVKMKCYELNAKQWKYLTSPFARKEREEDNEEFCASQ